MTTLELVKQSQMMTKSSTTQFTAGLSPSDLSKIWKHVALPGAKVFQRFVAQNLRCLVVKLQRDGVDHKEMSQWLNVSCFCS